MLPPIAHEPTTKTGLTHSDAALSAPRFAPGTARGDFTISLGGAPGRDADPKAPGDNLGFAVFGRVVEGLDIVAKILAAPTSTSKGDGVFKGEILEHDPMAQDKRMAETPDSGQRPRRDRDGAN